MAAMTSTMTAMKGIAAKATGRVAAPHLHLSLRAILVLAGLALLFLAAYRISLWIHPNRRCRPCKGTGKARGVIFTWARSYCRKCDGDGMVPRLGTLLIGGAGRGQGR
jgi:hypothetical protein